MHDERIGKLSLYAGAQTVLFVGAATGNGQEAARLVCDDEIVVNADDFKALWEQCHRDWHPATGGESRGDTTPTKPVTI